MVLKLSLLRKLKKSYEYKIRHVFAWCPITKLNLWCIIEASLGSHGRPWASPLASHDCLQEASIIHTQVQFSNTRPCKDVSNILYSYSLSSIFVICLLSPIVYVFWYELTGRRFDHFLIKRNLYLEWSSPVSLLQVTLSGYVTHCHWICH